MMHNCWQWSAGHTVTMCIYGFGFKVLCCGLGSIMLIFSVFTHTLSNVWNFYGIIIILLTLVFVCSQAIVC